MRFQERFGFGAENVRCEQSSKAPDKRGGIRPQERAGLAVAFS
jgi:hypothetical protein